MSEDPLFFNTFSHWNSEKDNSDFVLVDLAKMVSGRPAEIKMSSAGWVQIGSHQFLQIAIEIPYNWSSLTRCLCHNTQIFMFYVQFEKTDQDDSSDIPYQGLIDYDALVRL